jgi:hypothetical protein
VGADRATNGGQAAVWVVVRALWYLLARERRWLGMTSDAEEPKLQVAKRGGLPEDPILDAFAPGFVPQPQPLTLGRREPRLPVVEQPDGVCPTCGKP